MLSRSAAEVPGAGIVAWERNRVHADKVGGVLALFAALLALASVTAGCGERTAPPVPRDVLNRNLLNAVTDNNVAAVKRWLAEGADPNGMTEAGDTALLIAATNGRADLVEALIAGGAKVDLRRRGSWDEETPLYAAAAHGFTSVVRLLIDAGANPNVRRGANGADVHALYWAASKGDTGTVTLLLVNGATVEQRDLFAAVAGGHLHVVQRLLQVGADPRWSSSQFKDVLEAAHHSPEPTRAKMVALVRMFLSSKSTP